MATVKSRLAALEKATQAQAHQVIVVMWGDERVRVLDDGDGEIMTVTDFHRRYPDKDNMTIIRVVREDTGELVDLPPALSGPHIQTTWGDPDDD